MQSLEDRLGTETIEEDITIKDIAYTLWKNKLETGVGFPDGFVKENYLLLAEIAIEEHKEKHDGKYPLVKELKAKKLGSVFTPRIKRKQVYRSYSDILYGIGYTNPTSYKYDKQLTKYPWTVIADLRSGFSGFWDDEENERRALNWLLEVTSKRYYEIGNQDFKNNRLAGLLTKYEGSPYKLLHKIFPNLKPEMMKNRPNNCFRQNPDKKRKVVRTALMIRNKEPKELDHSFFEHPDIIKQDIPKGFLKDYYNNSPYLAAKEVEPDLKPWQMIHRVPNGTWDELQNRMEVAEFISKKKRKSVAKLKRRDFNGKDYNLKKIFEYTTLTELKEEYKQYKKEKRGF